MEITHLAIVPPGNFILKYKIKTLNEFWEVVNNEKSIFAKDRMYPTAFFFSWQLSIVHTWIERGYFWTTEKIEKATK
jgi:hypothetical protein